MADLRHVGIAMTRVKERLNRDLLALKMLLKLERLKKGKQYKNRKQLRRQKIKEIFVRVLKNCHQAAILLKLTSTLAQIPGRRCGT